MNSPFGEHMTWRTALDLGVGLLMLALAFVGIGASDVSDAGTQGYWSALAVGFALASYALQWAHADEDFRHGEAALRMAVHWVGVLAAIQLVHLFIASGRLANADTGLLEGVILALGTFLCGVHANWRLIAIGVALGLATAAVAYLEQYLWVMFGLGVLALAAILLVARARAARA